MPNSIGIPVQEANGTQTTAILTESEARFMRDTLDTWLKSQQGGRPPEVRITMPREPIKRKLVAMTSQGRAVLNQEILGAYDSLELIADGSYVYVYGF